MDGKNRVKCAYQQTVENKVKSAQEKDFGMMVDSLCTIFCGEIPGFQMAVQDFHKPSVENAGFCG
jgi:hypothetical protein